MVDNDLRYEIVISFQSEGPQPSVQAALSEIIMNPAIASISVFRRIDSDQSCLRLALGFNDGTQLSQVREASDYQDQITEIDSHADTVETSVWEPTAVQLAGDGDMLLSEADSHSVD